jgi:hypothetical protein
MSQQHVQSRTSFQVRGELALRAASTAAWNWCSRTSVLASRPQLGMCVKMIFAASKSPAVNDLQHWHHAMHHPKSRHGRCGFMCTWRISAPAIKDPGGPPWNPKQHPEHKPTSAKRLQSLTHPCKTTK